jgi:glucosyl-3-phosphoglycerate synthase
MDYKQELITTIHDFGYHPEALKNRLIEESEKTPTAVLIPSLYEELEKPALKKICDHLSQCHFVKNVVISLYAETFEEYAQGVNFFSFLPQNTTVIWENGNRIINILEKLQGEGINLLKYKGKGRAVWLGLGISSLQADFIALHDADIITYDQSYPLKLLFPLLEREFGMSFNKAFYARLGNFPHAFNGRVFRLFVTPLVNSLIELFGYKNYLCYLNSFRYPLSGEFALTNDLALNIRIPSNWGLEIELLAEVYRNISYKRISQIDLGIFDHKHQNLGDSIDSGLQKMCRDIFCSLLRTLTETEQVVITMDHIQALRIKFRRKAQDYIRQYFIDATFNSLAYDRHEEEIIVETFEQIILDGGKRYFSNPIDAQIPNWARAIAVIPDLREQLLAAAIADTNQAKTMLKI